MRNALKIVYITNMKQIAYFNHGNSRNSFSMLLNMAMSMYLVLAD